MQQQQQEPFTRLNCACVFLDSAAQLERDAQRAADAVHAVCAAAAAGDARRVMPYKEALTALRAELADLRQSHAEHVTVVKANYLRSMMELSKYHEINPMDQSTPGLQTSAYRRGDLTRLRNPPKKLTKKDKAAAAKKRTEQQAAKARKRTAAADAAKTRRVRKRTTAAADDDDDDDDDEVDGCNNNKKKRAPPVKRAKPAKAKRKPDAAAPRATVKPVPLALTLVRRPLSLLSSATTTQKASSE